MEAQTNPLLRFKGLGWPFTLYNVHLKSIWALLKWQSSKGEARVLVDVTVATRQGRRRSNVEAYEYLWPAFLVKLQHRVSQRVLKVLLLFVQAPTVLSDNTAVRAPVAFCYDLSLNVPASLDAVLYSGVIPRKRRTDL